LAEAFVEASFYARAVALTSKGHNKLARRTSNCSKNQVVKRTSRWHLACILMNEIKIFAEEPGVFADLTEQQSASRCRYSRVYLHRLSKMGRRRTQNVKRADIRMEDLLRLS